MRILACILPSFVASLIWLADEVWIPLDLEACYEATCKVFRLPPV